MPKIIFVFAALLAVFCTQNSYAITLTAGQRNFTTSGNITENSSGIISSLSGSSGDLNTITNLHTITTGNNGATSSGYGIRVTGTFNQVTNSASGQINTTGSSGRGISINGSSQALNQGTISTLGSSSYGIYVGQNNNLANNSGSINSAQSYGVYLDGNFNQFTNSGTITTTGGTSAYGVYISAGSDLAATEFDYSEVENSGNINSNDHGIYNKDHFTNITNSGNITPLNEASINGILNEGDFAVITNTGTINSARYAIYTSGEEVIINNSGNLNGEIRMGNSTLNILGGSITGIIQGNDAGIINIGSNLTTTDYTQENDFENISILTVNSGSSFTTNRKLEAQNIFVALAGDLNLENGFISDATIKGLSNGAGNVNLSAINFSGNLGASGNNLENINIASNASFTSSGDIFSNNVSTFGTLNFLANNNATIHGNLTINNGAAVNIEANNQIISGNFLLAENAVLATSLNNNQLGNFEISGNAEVENGAKLSLNFSNNDYIANGTRFTVLNADGVNNITEISAENISINNNSSNIFGLLRFTTIADSNNLYLEANHLDATEVSSNKNVQNIYSALGEIGANSNGKLREFKNYLDNTNLAPDALNLTINQAAPFPTKASLLATTNIVNNIIKIDERRLDKSRFNQEMNDGFWAEAFGNNLNQNQVEDDDGFSANSVGVVFGFDRNILEDRSIGASLSYAQSELKTLDDSKSNLISTYQLSIFGQEKFDKYFLDLIGSFALHQYSQNKNINAASASSSARYNGQTYAAKIKLSKIENLKYDLKLIPEFSLNLMHSQIDGYLENGSDSLDLKVDGVAANYLEARVGAALGWLTRIPELNEFKKFTLLAKISLGQNIINDKPTTSAKFSANNQVFEQKISQLDATNLRLGFEIDAAHIDDVTFGFEYFLEKRTSLQSHFLIAKVRQAF